MIFPLEPAPGGFRGINFHYLPFGARAAFLRQLSEYASDSNFDRKTRYNLSFVNNSYFKKATLLGSVDSLKNLTIIEKDLVSIFEKNKINKILTIGKKFDPNFHQAMSEIEDEQAEPGTILQEIQAGYMLGVRLLRPALVGVAKKSEKNKEKKAWNNLVDGKKTPI